MKRKLDNISHGGARIPNSNKAKRAASSNHAESAAIKLSEAERALGMLAMRNAQRLYQKGWRQTVEEIRGRPNISAHVGQLPHRATRLLRHLGRRGASAPLCTAPWSRQQCNDAAQRGPHQSSSGERGSECPHWVWCHNATDAPG